MQSLGQCSGKNLLGQRSLVVFGTGQVEMALVFSGEGATPSAEYAKPKRVVLLFPKKHLEPRSSCQLAKDSP